MKTTTFTIKNNNTNNNTNSGSTNYSSMLDSLILSNIKKTTPYIFNDYKDDNTTTYTFKKHTSIDPFIAAMLTEHGDHTPSSLTLKDIDYIKAAKFLANYKSSNKIKYGKVYHLANGTPIIFFKDEVQIGFDAYDYDDLLNIDFINGLTDEKKDMIINIVININL